MVAALVSKSQELNDQRLDDREELVDTCMRVICFSADDVKTLDEILMWSHYASKHYGLRIGFEFPEGIKHPFMIVPIDYREKRVEADLSYGSKIEAMTAALEESAKVKSLAWRYENEYRLITMPELCRAREMPDSTIEHFLDFKREWVKRVDFGVRCPQAEIQRVIGLLKSDYPHVVFRRADFHKSEYALEYKEI
jgi:Protein of unknown function (DUF2971)